MAQAASRGGKRRTRGAVPIALARRLLGWAGPRLLVLLAWYYVVGAGVISTDAGYLDWAKNRAIFDAGLWAFLPCCAAIIVFGANILAADMRRGTVRAMVAGALVLFWSLTSSVYLGAWGDKHRMQYPPLLRPDRFARAYVQALRSK